MHLEMIKAAILLECADVSAEAKLLFIRFLAANEDRGYSATTAQLAEVHGIAVNAVSRAAAELEGANLWTRVSIPQGRGRPSYEYRVAPAAWERLRSVAEVHAAGFRAWPFVERLITRRSGPVRVVTRRSSADGKERRLPGRAGEGRQLSNPNRLLLMVLLALSDDVGVVQGVGIAKLAALTGLTKTRVQSQAQKLLKLGYLRAVVSGFSGHGLFGKVPSVYFLNLHHPSYGRKGMAGGAIFLLESGEPGLREGPGLMVAASRGTPFRVRACPGAALPDDPLAGCESLIRELAPLLNSQSSTELTAYVQYVIEGCASRLLSDHWGRLCTSPRGTSPELYADGFLLDQIARLLMPSNIREEASAAGRVPHEYTRLSALIYLVALRLAEMIKYTLHRTELPPALASVSSAYPQMNFLLMSANVLQSTSRFAVIAVPKATLRWVGDCHVARVEFTKTKAFVWNDDSVHLDAWSMAELAQWGLNAAME